MVLEALKKGLAVETLEELVLNLKEVLTDSIDQDSSMIFHQHFLEAGGLTHVKVGHFARALLSRSPFFLFDFGEALKGDVEDISVVQAQREFVFDGDVVLEERAGEEGGVRLNIPVALFVGHCFCCERTILYI